MVVDQGISAIHIDCFNFLRLLTFSGEKYNQEWSNHESDFELAGVQRGVSGYTFAFLE